MLSCVDSVSHTASPHLEWMDAAPLPTFSHASPSHIQARCILSVEVSSSLWLRPSGLSPV